MASSILPQSSMASSILLQCQYHSVSNSNYNNIFCNEFCDFLPPPPLTTAAGNSHINGGAATMCVDFEALPLPSPFPFPFFDDNGGGAFPPPESDFGGGGVSDMAVPVLPPEFNIGLNLHDIAAGVGVGAGAGAGIQSFDLGSGYNQDVCEVGEEFNGFVPDLCTVYSLPNNHNRGFEVPLVPAFMEEEEEATMKVARYSLEEKKDRILRYLKKRNQRNFNKTIKYACRKTLADKRVRVRGRFARNNEQCEEAAATVRKKNNPLQDDHHQETEFYNNEDYTVKIKHDGEDWLQETMASLMYSPYI